LSHAAEWCRYRSLGLARGFMPVPATDLVVSIDLVELFAELQ
jgi:hypothetical protein